MASVADEQMIWWTVILINLSWVAVVNTETARLRSVLNRASLTKIISYPVHCNFVYTGLPPGLSCPCPIFQNTNYAKPLLLQKCSLHGDISWSESSLGAYVILEEMLWPESTILTHCSRETCKSVIGKQCRPRSDAAERSV